MRELTTDYGRVCVGSSEELFAEAARLGIAACGTAPVGRFAWALTGGSTPKGWYRWCVDQRALPADVLAATHWFVGDERCVPLASDESNFGNAQRLLLEPLGVPTANQHPWGDRAEPARLAQRFDRTARFFFGPNRCFSLCFLGLGDDAHTASLFPGSPLLAAAASVPAMISADDGAKPEAPHFAAVEVPERGWRLTITPAGLCTCGQIVVMATGAAKAAAVRRVFRGGESMLAVPAKVLRACGPRVTWLLDEAAASGLSAS
jgi:6-phosphogluconolactonase